MHACADIELQEKWESEQSLTSIATRIVISEEVLTATVA